MEKLKKKKLFLMDLDGTLYLEDKLFPATPGFLKHIKSIGGKYFFMTNNSSKSVDAYVEKFARIGVDADEEDMLTSTQATVFYLKEHYKNKLLYAFGTESFKKQLSDSGLNITDSLDEGIECLVMGFDTELTFKKLDDASRLLTKGVDFVATNPDYVCPTSYGFVPDCGSVSDMLYNATKRRPKFIGKPEKYLTDLALKKTGYSKEETIIIGDRLYTDIACGINSGIDTILVLSGESALKDAEASEFKPTYIMRGIDELLEILSGRQ